MISASSLVQGTWTSLTHIIIEAQQGSREFYISLLHSRSSSGDALILPFSPFMTTHILEPTHLSISSVYLVNSRCFKGDQEYLSST